MRKLSFPHWKPWSASKNRCLVPVTSFAEPDPASQEEGGKVPNAWFARDQEKSLTFFVGIHVPQSRSVRKVRDGLTTGRALWVFDQVSQQPGEADPREGHARPSRVPLPMSAFSVPVPPPKRRYTAWQRRWRWQGSELEAR
ncbi:hypothetical protein HNR29_004489 [Rhizobium leguminosarum]|nr:hypothetical protein [Rhizobium leguminosarum]